MNSEINAGTGHQLSAQGTEEEPRFCLRKGSQGNQDSDSSSHTYPWQRQPRRGSPPKARTASRAGICFSTTYEWKEKVLKICHPLGLLFPVKLSGFSLSFLFGMKRSGLFWQPEGATKTNFLRATRVPPIKAICRWPGSQRSASGCLRPIKGTLFQQSDP